MATESRRRSQQMMMLTANNAREPLGGRAVDGNDVGNDDNHSIQFC